MIVVEICHASDAAAGNWKAVDHLSKFSLLKDYFESPTFEWNIGTLVRAREDDEIHYVGAYNAHECVDLSHDSRVMSRADWGRSGITKPIPPNEDFVTSILQCTNPEGFMYVIAAFLSKPKTYQIARRCLNLITQYLPDGIMSLSDEYMVDNATSDQVWNRHELNRNIIYSNRPWQQRDAAYAANSIMKFALTFSRDELGTGILFITSVLSNKFVDDVAEVKRKIMAVIWNHISMYEIITAAIE